MTVGSRAILTGTYRLQFSKNFTFSQAEHLVPYLAALGVSHIYASPYLKARAGSSHGYDITDYNALNPEIGDDAALAAMVASLHRGGFFPAGGLLQTLPFGVFLAEGEPGVGIAAPG